MQANIFLMVLPCKHWAYSTFFSISGLMGHEPGPVSPDGVEIYEALWLLAGLVESFGVATIILT